MNQKYFWRVLIGAFVYSMLTACNGGGGGGGGPAALATGTFTKTVPTLTPDTGAGGFNNSAPYIRFQFLYPASTIQAAGKVTGITVQYRAALASSVSCPNVTIKLGQTNLANLTTTFANNVQTGQGSQITVLNNSAVTFPAGAAGTFYTIPLTTPFDYNGADNLVVDIERTSACSGSLSDEAVTNVGYTAFAFTNTSGSATGVTGTGAQTYKLVFAGGDDKLNYGGAGSNSWPFDDVATGTGGAGSLRIQNLYLASEINGSGPITGIAFQTNATTVAGAYTYTLKLGHSTLAALTTTFANNYTGSLTTVANAVTNFTIPAGIPSGEWLWVPIPDGVFTYNGTNNLLVEVATTAGTASNILRTYTAFANRRAAANGATATTADSVDSSLYHIALRFNGGPVNVFSNGATSTAFPFNTAAAGRLNLYRASELGSAGTITSVACRLNDTSSTATNYATYKVIIGHSSVETLSATSASNFVSQSTVVNGTVSVSAGLVRGDWIEIPLSSSFNYDGKSNLAIWMGTTGASGAAISQSCQANSLDAVRYPAQIASGSPGDTTVGPQDSKLDMKLKISR